MNTLETIIAFTVLTCEDEDHELEIFEVGDVFDTLKCKKCGQLRTEWT